jgi:hypothetical protein
VSFPPGLTTIEVTGRNVVAFDGTPLSGVVIFSASAPVADPGGSALIEGSATGLVVSGVMAPINIPTTDSVSPGFTYTITQRLQTVDGAAGSPEPAAGVSIPASLGASVDLSALVP